ncbi:phospholipase D-like domain-containing protein [Actinospica sp.]|uniref:phospholipase D-like domain-containing protein n=1 Tax=Actinospica sp. TaxID=1872142 RepID=UPI002B7FC400|nr:phospholipase D-like domain-containing protein [Actinospica sp.]HWG27394.1 phospholipase D-like domain-containing protein [Actinospica sp.]
MRIGAFRKTALALAGGLAATALAGYPAHAATGTYTGFVFNTSSVSEPTIYDFINSATTTLDMTMYELVDTTAVNDLVAREKAGVTVRVVLDGQHASYNSSAISKLKAAGVGVVESNTSRFTYTHQKTITIDGDQSMILTGNLTSKYYTTSCDYGVIDTDATDVAAIEKVFNADYANTAITPGDGDDLLWSPNTATSRLLSVINGATKTLDVEEEEFSSSSLVSAVVARAKAGVQVRVVVEDPSSYSSEVSEVKAAGGTVVGYSSSTGYYIHAKAVVADYGLSDATVELGSMNWTSNSLDSNRELGIILNDTGVEKVVETQFNSDYAGGTAQ